MLDAPQDKLSYPSALCFTRLRIIIAGGTDVMAKPFVPWSKEKNDRWNARRERQRAETDRCLLAGIEALKRGEDPGPAMEAAQDKPARSAPAAAAAASATEFAALLEPRKLRVDGWTADMQRDFIRALADTGCVSHAARAVGVSRTTAYALRHRASHGVFALAWDVAIQFGRKRLLDIAMERATEGQEVAVWYRGEMVGTRTVYNDRLLTFLLAHEPRPAEPLLSPDELAAMFPAMLDAIDSLRPHPVAARLAREAAELEAKDAEEDEF